MIFWKSGPWFLVDVILGFLTELELLLSTKCNQICIVRILLTVSATLAIVCLYCLAVILYEGHPVNQLLNGIILSIFRIWKIWDIRFIGNLFLNTSCEFHSGDVIMMTSPAFWTQSVSAVFYPAVFFHNSWVLYTHIASYENRKTRPSMTE